MSALLHCAKARRKPDGWYSPRSNVFIKDGNDDVFVLDAENSDTGETIISFVIDRATLEQIEDGIRKALTIDPVVICRCEP